jgi:hypothetical protein
MQMFGILAIYLPRYVSHCLSPQKQIGYYSAGTYPPLFLYLLRRATLSAICLPLHDIHPIPSFCLDLLAEKLLRTSVGEDWTKYEGPFYLSTTRH